MDDGLLDRMLAYYDERASEYEQAYTRGTGTASITDPAVFTTEVAVLEGIVRGFGRGHLLDVACGTGYWLPHYIGNCSRVTLFDQSERMLAECELKVARLSGPGRCSLVRGDVFDYEFRPFAHDSALVGFLLSHLSEEQERVFMQVLRRTLRADSRVLILESAWTDLRAKFNEKAGRQLRRLNDGTEFHIYKRYISRADIAAWDRKYGLTSNIEHFGDALCAVSVSFAKVAYVDNEQIEPTLALTCIRGNRRAVALDPVSWTSSERRIRCPDRWQTPPNAGPAGDSMRTSKPRLSGSCSTRARAWVVSPATSI